MPVVPDLPKGMIRAVPSADSGRDRPGSGRVRARLARAIELARARAAAPPTAELLQALRDRGGGERITLGEIAEATAGRAHGLMLLLLALPETIPMVGLSAVIALPIAVIGGHMALYGAEAPLPRWLRERSIRRSLVEAAIDKAMPVIRWLDRISRPRWPALAEAHRLQGAICVVLAVVLAAPIPGINILAAFGVAGIGLGMLQRDGLVVAAALVSAGLALAGTAGVLVGGGALLLELVNG